MSNDVIYLSAGTPLSDLEDSPNTKWSVCNFPFYLFIFFYKPDEPF